MLRHIAKGAFAAADALMPTLRGPRLLIYHLVGTGVGKQMEVTPEDFRWQLDWLAQNRELVDLGTAIRRWQEPDSDRFVVVSFDDGYETTFNTAFPLLSEHRIPFVLYVATQMIEDGHMDGVPALSWEQISEMLESGLLTIGAHTHSHRDLRTPDEPAIAHEIRHSNLLIEEKVGIKPRHFAYPWGYWSEAAHGVVSSTYDSAVLGAATRPSSFDAYRLHRFPIQLSDGRAWFSARLRGGLVVEERIRRQLRGYRGP